MIARSISILLIVLGCLSLAGYRHPKSSQASSARTPSVVTEAKTETTLPKDSGPSEQASGGSVIGRLKTRDKFITIRTGADGPLYTVKSKEGKTLAMDIPAAQLSARFPELKDVVERGIAGDDASLSPRYWQIKAPIDSNETRTIIIEHNNIF